MRQKVSLVIPVKGIDSGKSRLSPSLGRSDRRTLVRWLFDRTLALAGTLVHPEQIFVVSADNEVLTGARRAGSCPVRQTTEGLNEGLSEVSARLPGCRLVILPVDLPNVEDADLKHHIDLDGVGLSPDRKRIGTNLLSLPRPCAIKYCFGPRSFEAHYRAGIDAGIAVTVIDREGIGFDLDTPEDLEEWTDRATALGAGIGTPKPSLSTLQ